MIKCVTSNTRHHNNNELKRHAPLVFGEGLQSHRYNKFGAVTGALGLGRCCVGDKY